MYEYIPQLSQDQTDLFGANGKMKHCNQNILSAIPPTQRRLQPVTIWVFFKDSLPEVSSQVFVTPGLTSRGSKGKAARGVQCLPMCHHPGNNLAIATSFSKSC